MSDDKKTPGRPTPTQATTEELLAHHNSQVPAYNDAVRARFDDANKVAMLLMDEIPCVELLVSREVLIERIRRQNLRLGRSIKQSSQDLLMVKTLDDGSAPILKDGRYSVGLTYQYILRMLEVQFPEASTTVACLRWYSVHLKCDAADEGLPYPNLPQYRPRSSAPKALAA